MLFLTACLPNVDVLCSQSFGIQHGLTPSDDHKPFLRGQYKHDGRAISANYQSLASSYRRVFQRKFSSIFINYVSFVRLSRPLVPTLDRLCRDISPLAAEIPPPCYI